MSDTRTEDVLRALPKAELHVHVEGTLEPEMAFAFAERNRVRLPFTDVEALRRAYAFDDLQSFLNLYYACMRVLRTAQDFRDLALSYLERAHVDGVMHAEMFFDLQVHQDNGVAADDVVDGLRAALQEAQARWGISGGLILCFLRDRPVSAARAALDAVAHRAHGLLGIGLDSAEAGHPPGPFAQVFARAGELGLHRVAHAGEEGPPAYVIEAVERLDVERIDHGIRSVEDPAALRLLNERGIPLTVCPLSNVRLRAVEDLRRHPLRRLVDAGITVTVNSDDPAYFGGYIGDNYAALHHTGFSVDELTQMARDSLCASFATDERKADLLALLESRSATRRQQRPRPGR